MTEKQEPEIHTERSSISFIKTEKFYDNAGEKACPTFSEVRDYTMKSISALEENYELARGRLIVVPSITVGYGDKTRIHPHLYLLNDTGEIRLKSRREDIGSLWGVNESGPNWVYLWEPASLREKISEAATKPWGMKLEFLICENSESIDPKLLLRRSLTHHLHYAQHIYTGDTPTILTTLPGFDSAPSVNEYYEGLPKLYSFRNGETDLRIGKGTSISVCHTYKPVSQAELRKKYEKEDKDRSQ